MAEVVEEFVAAAADGFGMEPGDRGDLLESAVAESLGFAGGDPASLLFVQPAEEEVELVVAVPFGMVSGETGGASAFVNRRWRRHDLAPSLE